MVDSLQPAKLLFSSLQSRCLLAASSSPHLHGAPDDDVFDDGDGDDCDDDVGGGDNLVVRLKQVAELLSSYFVAPAIFKTAPNCDDHHDYDHGDDHDNLIVGVKQVSSRKYQTFLK